MTAQLAGAALTHRTVSIASSQRLDKGEMPTSRASNSPKPRPPILRPGCARQARSKDKSAPPDQRLPSRRPPRRPHGTMRRASDHRGVRQMPSPRGRPQAAPGRAAVELAEAGRSTTPHARTAPGAHGGRPPVGGTEFLGWPCSDLPLMLPNIADGLRGSPRYRAGT
jgi:hypothetical protein